jgi:hypothetical protein
VLFRSLEALDRAIARVAAGDRVEDAGALAMRGRMTRL